MVWQCILQSAVWSKPRKQNLPTKLDKQSRRKSRRNYNANTRGHKYSPLLQDLGNGPMCLFLKRFAAEILDRRKGRQERCAYGLLFGLLGV